MKFARSFALFIAFAAVTGFRADDDTFSLKQKYKKDDIDVYHMNFNISAEGMEMVFDSKSRYKIVSVEEDGAYEMEETLIEGTLKFNGEETVMEKGEPKVRKYDKDGVAKKVEGEDEEDDDPVSKIVEDVFKIEPKAPVKIGESWKRESEYATVNIKLEGKEKIGDIECLKVSLTATLNKKDTAGDASGTFYLRATDFRLEKMDAKFDNPKLEEEAVLKKIDIKMERVAE